MELERLAGLVEQLEAELLGQVGGVEPLPEDLHVEQPLGGDEGGGDLAERGAFLLGQREGRGDAEPVDEAVGDLGGDDLAAQAMLRGWRRRGAPASSPGRRRTARGSRVGSSVILPASSAAWSAIFEVERRMASSGRVRPRSSWARRISSSLRFEALDRAVEPAALLEHLDRPEQRRKAGGAAALGDRQGQGLEAVVLEHDRGDLVGHLGEQGVAVLEREPALGHLAVQRDLDVDLIVRAVDAGAELSMKSVLIRPPAAANSIRAGLGDGEVGALADRLGAKLGAVDPDRVVAGIADLGVALALAP